MKNVSTYDAFESNFLRMNLITVLMVSNHLMEVHIRYTLAFLVFSNNK